MWYKILNAMEEYEIAETLGIEPKTSSVET